MPLEGHYARQTTPLYKLSSREIKTASLAFLVTIAAMLAVVFATVGDDNPAPAMGCINPNVAGIVGAETINACGSEAVEICQRASGLEGDRPETIVANCEKQGVRF